MSETADVAGAAERQLRELAEELAPYGLAAEVLDDGWRLVWTSEELQTIWGVRDPGQLGLERHILESRSRVLAGGVLTRESAERWLRTNLPFILAGTDGGSEAVADMLESDYASLLGELEPQAAPARWAGSFDFRRDEFFGRVNYLGERVQDACGRLLGYLFLYAPDVPASLASLLVRGNRRMYERMAALFEPGQRSAAILFADLEGSGTLSRRLASPVYFRLIRDIRSALDAAVAECGGIVGKHAGDGVSAFFLSQQLASESGAARATLETARRIPQLVREVAAKLADEGMPVEPDGCRMKVSVHWGPSLYIGQVASQGRLEVTALGDEMNEAARIEQSAKGGQVLASKTLLERLNQDDASAPGIKPARIAYRALAELERVAEKATRDAGAIAIADIARLTHD
jgi:class 3 adenylate cyclase